MFDEQDRQYFYNEFKNNGYEVGSYDDFKKDLNNEEDRNWYYNEAKNMGYDVGTQADFDKMVLEPAPSTSGGGKQVDASATTQSVEQKASTETKPQVAQPAKKQETTDKEPGLIAKVLDMIPTDVQTSNGTYQPSPEIPQPVVKGEEMPVKEETSSSSSANAASPESKEAAPVTTPTGVVNNESMMDAKLANYLENWKQRPDKQSTYFENLVADLLADGTANSNEEAVSIVKSALGRYANLSAMDVTNQVVSSLPDDTVQDAEKSIEAQWYSHGVQDKLKQEAYNMGISYDDYVGLFLKPAMVQSLVNKYGPNYRDIAEGIATRLYSHDENVQDRLMNQDINDALSSVISKYVNPSVVDEYNKAQEAGSKAFTEGMEGSQFIPANLRLGTALGAQYEANEAKDPAKVLSSLQKKFGNLYRNPKFLNDMSNAAFKVMQRYGLNGTQSSDPKQFKPMINSVLKNELDQLEIKGMMPKGSAEYIMKTGLGNTIVGKITRKAVQTDYQNWLEDIANQQYQPGFWENVASGALTFAGDAWSYWLPGAAGGKLTKSMVAKAEGKLTGDLMAKGMERKMAERAAKVLIGKSKTAALKSGAAHGAVTFGGQSAISKPIDEIYRTGQFDENGKIYNPSVGKVIANTLGEVAKQSAVGAIMQGGTIANMVGKGRGLATNILADIGGKVVDSGIMTGQQLLERMAHDPNFKPTGKDAAETFLESGANLLSIGFPGFVGKYARFKDAREFNKKFDFSDQDIAELKRFGYDGLRDAFEKMGIGEYAVVGENAQRLDGQLTQKYMNLMNDKSVPEVLKAKIMAVVEGKRPSSFSPVIDSEVYRGDDGKYYLETYNKDGGVIDRKEYSSHDAARNDEKKLEYEKTLGLASVLEGEFHNEFTQEHLDGLYNKAAQKYNMGEKLTDEDKAAVYLHQNAGAIKEIMDKQQKGIILTDEEQKQVNAYRHYYDSALENSSVMREFVNTFEDSHDVARGTLRKALESKDKKYAPLVESYLKELYNSIELKREMKQTMDDLYNTSHGNEQKRIEQSGIEGEKPATPVEGAAPIEGSASVEASAPAGGQEPPVSAEPAPYQDRTNSVPSPNDANSAANVANSSAEVAASDAFVMGQNAYKNGDSEALQAIDYNSDLATGRLKRAFADNEKMPDIVANAYSEGKDMDLFVAQRAGSLSPAQKEAISKYVEAMDAKKGAIDALQHADDGYGEALKEQFWPYQTEDGNIVPATLDSGKQVFLKKANEYGGAFVVVPDEQGQPMIKQVSNAEIKVVGTPVSLDEYIENAVAQQKDARAQQFISQFDGSGLKPNDQVTVAMEEGDANINMTFAGYSKDGKIVLTDGKDYLPLSKEEFAAWRKNALDNTINEHLDAEDVEREQKAASQAEADKKQRYANGIVGLSEGQPDYSSNDTDPNVAAEYLQEQFGEDHGKLLNLVNGSRDDIKTQLANKRKAAIEYQNWLDTNADLDPEKAKKVEDELSLVNEQIADLDARFKNWNTIRNSVMTPDEVKAMKEERKAEVEKAGVDESAIVPSDDFHVLVLEDEELKKQYPTMDEATDYITSQRKDLYHTQEDVERKINGVNDMLNQYINGETELDPTQLMELNTTKAQLEALQTNLSVAAKGLKAQANKLSKLYKTEVSKQEMEKLGMTPSEQRKALVADALKKNDMKAIHEIYKDASVDVMDLTPQTLEEAVSESLLPHSLNPESLQYELGKSNFKFDIGKRYDSNKFNYLIAKKGTGMSVNEFAVRVYNDLPVNLLDMGYSNQDVRNALLDMFKSYDSVKEMRNVALMNRIAAAEDELSSEEEYYEAQKEREIIERQAEIEKYKSYIHEKELSLPPESELDYINGLEFDRMMEIEDREREYKQYVKSILPELADYDDRSNEEGYGGGSSLGSDSSRRGVDEGNSQGEEVGNGEASSESEIGEGSDSGRKGRQEAGSMEPGEGSAVRGSHLPQEASFGERLKSAIAETETEPTEAQKKAGNYKKGHLSFGGYDYTVETPKGVTRSGKDEQGKPWSVTMHDTYGYILGKIGVDGDHIDMFINDAADLDTFDGNVYVVDQVNPETGEFDEHKVMYGYPDEAAATKAYLSNYSKGWKGLGKVTSVPKVTFDKWLESSDRKTKPFRDYAMIQHEQAKKANETLPFDAPMSMDDLPFHRDVKEVKPENLTEAQKVAYDAVSTMLKKAGIPVKVVSNEDMEKVAEAQDNLAVEMLLNDPRLRFYIKTPEQKEAAKAAYDWAAKNRPDKFKQYAIVNMDNPNQPPQYFEKKDLAEKWRKYYTNAWKIGNYKAFNLNKPFEEQIKDVKGDVPSEFDPYKAESLLNKRIELEKQIKETEDSYNAKKKERAEYQNQLMQDYMDQHGLSSENDIPDDVWTDYRDKSFEKYQDTLDDLFHKYVELDNQLKAVAEPGVQYLKGKGVVYGYTDGKQIVLNQEHLNPNTPIHEYQHLWRTAAKKMNPELIEHGDKLIMQTQLFADLKKDPNYNHLTDEQICDEAFARLTGEDGAAILEQMAKAAIKENPLDTAKELSVINKLKEWLKKFWYWTLDTFTKWKPEDIKKMTLEDIRNLVMRDLANGVDPRTKLHEAENADDIKFMGSTTKKRMKSIASLFEGRELNKDQQTVADVYSGKKDNLPLTVEREDGNLKIIMRQGNDNHAGTKHSVFRHYGVKANSLNIDDLLLIPTVLKEGERKVSDNGRVAYVYVDPTSQVKYTVVTEPKNNKEFFNDFYSNKKANPSETSRVVENSTNTPEGAHNNDGNAFMRAKVDNNSETAKENGENLSVEDKIKAVSQQFGVDEADVAMYANAIKKGSTSEAARARANIKRHLLQANEDKISSFKELLKYTVPVNEALKENFGDVDAMIEERKQQMEAQRNAMEAARKRAEEEEAKRQKHLEELSLIPDDQLDKQYMDALAKGDDATAREMLDEAARRKGYDDTESAYQGVGAWAAPGNPGYESDKARRDDWESSGSDVNLEDIALGYTPQPDDYFSHPERYSQNTPHGLESVKAINTAIDAIKNGEKDVKVKVYRAVPTSVKEGKLRNGDWVTPSKKYAEMHGTNRLEGKYRIIEDEVPATQLWWDGNDANEFGFDDGKAYKYKNAKNNRKLNDLVTYDDNGDVIPPSKRFNSRKQDVRFMFGGEKGAAEADKAEEKTYRMDNLKVAEKMERGKKDAKAIKLATGWERGADGKWRYEMPDAKIKDMKDIGGGHIVKRFDDDMLWNDGNLSDVIDAPGLFEAYPQLKDVRIDTDAIMNDMPSNGDYNAKTNTITIHADELKYMNSILNHEIQHAIQHIEGFASGGNPENIRDKIEEIVHENSPAAEYARQMLKTWSGMKIAAINLGRYKDMIKSDREALRETAAEYFFDALNMLDDNPNSKLVNDWDQFDDKTAMEIAESGYHVDEAIKELNRLADEYWKTIPEGNKDALGIVNKLGDLLENLSDDELYWNLAGETEARNVEKRLGMTNEERRNSLASETEDVNRDEQIVMNGNDASYSIVKDPETIKKLDKEETVKVYRAMQVGEDGKLYPPMAAKVKGKFVEPIELGKWEQADERPELADDKGMFTLNKGNGKSLKAAYNPYIHTSRTPLNDQFSEAQNRPNIVTVEVEVPKSELTSGYKADKAKDAVGEVEWKAGIIQGQLTGKRKVVLSRWDKPVRIVPDSEVADVIVNDMFKGKNITMPSNVVTPSLRKELEKRGVPFVETDNRGRIVGGENDGVHYSKMYGKNVQSPVLEQKLKKHPDSLMKAGTYFSGGGLVEEGLKGIIDPVVAVEYDRKISGVYRNNFGQHIVTADVRDVDPKELVKHIDGEVEYFHASPVCKNYSQAKSNGGEVELDKETAKSTADFINAVKPRVVTIENVKGYKDSEAMKIITQALDKNGYKWDADVYNAADYGGYTSRERLIIRAVKDGELPEKPKKQPRKGGWLEAVEDILPTLTVKESGVAPWMDARLKADGIDWQKVEKPLYVMGSAYADGKIPHAYGDEILPTLRTKSGDVIIMPGGKVLRADGRVLARISGLGDDYKLPKTESLAHTIIGNGIPVQLTQGVIAPLLNKDDLSGRNVLARLGSSIFKNNWDADKQKQVSDRVVNTANKLGGAEATVYPSVDEVPDAYLSDVKNGATGWYDPTTHTVHVYLPNCADANEAERTVLHEKIGHEGMEVLLGGEDGVRKFANFVYRSVGKDVRGKIIDFANKYDPDWKNPDRMNVGTQEYIAHLAEEGPKTAEDFSLWTKIKHYLIKLLKKLGVRVPGLLNDKDLRYYLMKAGKALHVWDEMPETQQEAMMKQASNAEIKDALSDGAGKGKPRQKKGESTIQYMKRVQEWRKWQNAREDKENPEPPIFYDIDKDEAGKKEWAQLNKDWRERHHLVGEEPTGMPIRMENEEDDAYMNRIHEYEKWQAAMKDQKDPLPDMFAFEKKKQEEVKRKYEDWLAKHDLLEQQQADLDLYEGKIYPAETNPKADALEQQVMQDLAEVTSTDVSKEGAAMTVKHAVIHRRKNMEEASADDAIYINDVKNRIEKMADSGVFDKLLSDYKGKKNRAEKLAETIPYIIEAPRRLRDMAHNLNATGVFDKGHIHIQPADVEAIQPYVTDLITETAKKHTEIKKGKEIEVYDDPKAVSEVASKMAQAINANHQGEEGFVPCDGTDILSKHVLKLVKERVVPGRINYKELSPEMQAAIDSIRDWYNYTYDWLMDNHTLKAGTGYNVDYVNHIWDKEKSDPEAYATFVENRQRTKSPNEKPRTISTLMEGIYAGLVPKTTDITKMMAYYSRSNIEAWANKTMLQELTGLNVIERNEKGEVISTDPLLSSSAPFNLEQYKYFEIPGVGPVWVYNVSPKQVKVKNPITDNEKVIYSEASAGDRFGVVFDTYQSSPFWKTFDTLASSAKKLELGFSGFHAGALTEVYMVQNMVEFGPKKAMANFMKYIFADTAKNHELPCFANPEDFQEAASHLVKFGATNDYAAADVQNMFDNMRDAMMKVQEKLKDGNKISGTVAKASMPLKVATQMLSLINKGMDVALWDFLHDGLKLATYRMRADKTKERAKKKGWSAEELNRALDEDGQFVNDMFGGQHWDVLGASHRTLRYAGRVLLSPDWNASTTRHFLALTGFGSIWNEATFENFKQYYKRLKHKELTPEDEGRRSRQISALLCYGIGFMVFYEGIANGINAAFRALDEEKERKKAEEIRKTNPSYKSMYELAYGDEGMKWYDYLMRGNSLGQQSKIFLGRYEDGTEMYVRHGKQFREVPEYLFNHKGELEFPGPMVQRMIGKANPMVRMTLDDINYLSDFQASHADQEIQRKYGKTIGLLYKDALYWAPFLIPSQENKEFKAVDFFFPSSKGFSPWKAQSYFKDFILSGDMEGVVMTYQSCQRNGIDPEAQIKAAIGSVKALESAEMSDGVTSLQEASKRFDAAKSITEKKKMRQKMKKFLSQSDYKAFTQKEALDMVQGYLNGDEDLKEMEKAESKYLMKAKAEDVTEDWRIQNVWNGTIETYQEYQRLKDVDKAKANAFKNSKTNKRLFAARKAISAARRKMNKAKKQMDGTNDAAKLVEIRNTRKELLKTLNGME
jgi:site-specific DNA-cytosine methylase